MVTTKQLLLQLLLSNPLSVNVDNIDVEQAYCLALNIFHESRGESIPGQIAVAHTTLNRVAHPQYPDSICEVVTDPGHGNGLTGCAFSWYCDGLPDKVKVYRNGDFTVAADAFLRSASIAILVIDGLIPDNTAGATHYYNYHVVNPRWSSYYENTAIIGNHTFLKREPHSPH